VGPAWSCPRPAGPRAPGADAPPATAGPAGAAAGWGKRRPRARVVDAGAQLGGRRRRGQVGAAQRGSAQAAKPSCEAPGSGASGLEPLPRKTAVAGRLRGLRRCCKRLWICGKASRVASVLHAAVDLQEGFAGCVGPTKRQWICRKASRLTPLLQRACGFAAYAAPARAGSSQPFRPKSKSNGAWVSSSSCAPARVAWAWRRISANTSSGCSSTAWPQKRRTR
jgi:hypothetical protein